MPFTATLALAPTRAGTVWLIMAKPEHVTTHLAARVAAVVTAHAQFPLLHPCLHPRRPAAAVGFILPNGAIGDPRHQFPTRLVREIDRVARVLTLGHGPYVTALASALRGRRPAGFAPIPAELGFTDPANECAWAPPPPRVSVRTNELVPFNVPDALLHVVAEDYSRERYLEGLTDDEVMQRAEDALVNTHNFEEPSALVVDVADASIVRSLARLTEAVAEMRLRHGGTTERWMAELLPRWALPEPGRPLIERVNTYIKGVTEHPSDGLVKYGRREHLAPMLERGRVRLAPAAAYADPSLNRARQATELELEVFVDTTRTRFQVLDEAGEEVLGTLSPPRATITRRARSNYLVLCTSRRLSARLFFDFDADACLVVRDRAEFVRRLTAAVSDALPGWAFSQGDVRYFDPFSPDAGRASIPFFKPVRYEYQHEHRIAVVPPESTDTLDPVFVELGPLHDIATLFVPGDSVPK